MDIPSLSGRFALTKRRVNSWLRFGTNCYGLTIWKFGKQISSHCLVDNTMKVGSSFSRLRIISSFTRMFNTQIAISWISKLAQAYILLCMSSNISSFSFNDTCLEQQTVPMHIIAPLHIPHRYLMSSLLAGWLLSASLTRSIQCYMNFSLRKKSMPYLVIPSKSNRLRGWINGW